MNHAILRAEKFRRRGPDPNMMSRKEKYERRTKKKQIQGIWLLFILSEERLLMALAGTPIRNASIAKCLLEDPEYLALQERIEENRRKNQMAEKKEEPPRIRRQTKSRAQILEEEIQRKEKYARTCYRANRPRAGDNATYEIVRLRAKLRELKGAAK